MLAQDLVEAFGANRLLTYASPAAFRILVALIPLALLGIALLGALGEQHVWRDTLAPRIEHRVLPQVWSGVNATVEQIFRTGGWVLIAFAIVLSINYRTGPGVLAAFLVLTTYVYTSSIIFMVGIQLDDLLRAEG